MSDIIRVLLVDDHPIFRGGMRLALTDIPDAQLVGEAATGEEAVAMSADLLPDVVLMDLNLPGIDGITATQRLLEVCPNVSVLVLTMLDDDDSVFSAMRAGARGYVVKGADQDEIVRAVQAVSRGEAIFSPSVAAKVIAYFSAATRPTAPPKALFPGLTARELEILDLIAAGENNTTIAARLYLSPKTVRNHITNVFSKLQVADRAEAIVRARQAGYG